MVAYFQTLAVAFCDPKGYKDCNNYVSKLPIYEQPLLVAESPTVLYTDVPNYIGYSQLKQFSVH